MKTKDALPGLSIAIILQLGILAASAQTNIYLFTGYETNITLPAGTYNITAYGAQGGSGYNSGGLGAEMSGEFSFSTNTALILLVGGSGSYAGGGGGSFVVNGSTPLVIAGGGGGAYSTLAGGSGLTGTGGGGIGGTGGGGGIGAGGGGGGGYSGNGSNGNGYGGSSFISGGNVVGDGGYGGGGGAANGGGGYSGGGGGGGGGGNGGGSIIDSSAITNLAEVSGIASPDDSTGNGEIIIAAVPGTPLGIATVSNLPVVVWPASATNVVLQMTTNLTSGNWVTVTNGIPFTGLQITNAPGTAFFRLQQ